MSASIVPVAPDNLLLEKSIFPRFAMSDQLAGRGPEQSRENNCSPTFSVWLLPSIPCQVALYANVAWFALIVT